MIGKSWNRAISFLLSFLLIFELIPAWVFADDQDPSEAEESYAEEQETLADEEADFEDDIIVEEFARNIASSEKAVIAEELPGSRDEYQKEFIMESGMNLFTVYPIPVHYDKEGK